MNQKIELGAFDDAQHSNSFAIASWLFSPKNFCDEEKKIERKCCVMKAHQTFSSDASLYHFSIWTPEIPGSSARCLESKSSRSEVGCMDERREAYQDSRTRRKYSQTRCRRKSLIKIETMCDGRECGNGEKFQGLSDASSCRAKASRTRKSKSDETMSNASGRFLPPEHFSSRKASRGLRKVIIPLASTINYSVTAEFLWN